MKSSLLRFVFFAAAFFLVSGEKDGTAENENPTDGKKERKSNDDLKTNQESKTSEAETSQRRPDFLLTPDDRLIINPQFQPAPFPGSAAQGAGFLFPDQKQNLYNVRPQNFQPQSLDAVLGPISAQILGQRSNQDYVPYPPNGDPYNYPAYRGQAHATEPPVVRAYETANSANYGAHPTANFAHYSPRRLFSNNGYYPDHFNHFGLGFYNNNNPYNSGFGDGGFYLRRNDESAYDGQFYHERNRDLRGPIKRAV